MYRCPRPAIWSEVHSQLCRFRSRNSDDIPEPPKPLILAGWTYSSSHEKHDRWLQTVEWATKYGCPELIDRIADSDFVTLDQG
jgi:hypothetical protein